jgi:ERF superfamily protein
MNEIVVSGDTPQVPSLLNLIAATARDPTVDIAKFETLLRMQREIIADDAKLQFNRAMNKAQAEMVPVVRDAKNDQTHSRYARLETIDEAIRPIYTKHGFSLSFNAEQGAAISLSCEVAHEAGFTRTYHLPDCAPDTAGAKGQTNKTELHGLGSTVSYLRRYLTCMIFHVILTNEDDDGNRGGKALASQQQREPPPPRPRDGWDDRWFKAAVGRLESASDSWKWLNVLVAALTAAPSLRDLEALAGLSAVLEARETAPAEVRERIVAALDAALARLKAPPAVDKASTQQNPKTEASRQPPPKTEPSRQPVDFEAILIDADGEPQDAMYDNPRVYAEAFVALWRGAHLDQQRALFEYNADGLDAAHAYAADILDVMVEQKVLPPIAVVEPPAERGKPSWAGYVKAIRLAMTTLDRERFEEWTLMQRATIEKAPLAQRVLVVRAIVEVAGTMDVHPPQWLGELMRKPATAEKSASNVAEEINTPTEPVSDVDEKWVNNRIAELVDITDRDQFDMLIGSLAVRTVMARLRRDKPALFGRADAAFSTKHQALPPVGTEGA